MTEKLDLVSNLRDALDTERYNDDYIERLISDVEQLKADAERFRLLRDLQCVALHLHRNDHATDYRSAKEKIEDCDSSYYDGTEPAELQRMKDTNTIWTLHWYPDTPIGFCKSHGATLEAALDALIGNG
jgi:hypothetical protein